MKILNKKEQHSVAMRIIANYMIATDALKKCDMSVPEYIDAIEHLTENTIESLTKVVGLGGLMFYTNKFNLATIKI